RTLSLAVCRRVADDSQFFYLCPMSPAIQIQNVTKYYGANKALDNLSLDVNQGEIYGFIGPNGAGKSTAIRLLLNFIQMQSGSVTVLGLSPTKDDVAIKKQTGYVSSESFMYNDMRVAELFKFTESFHKIKAPERIKKLVDVLEIDVHKKFEELSFGNRKKVAIACALLHQPKLIILDEPSNGLDPVIRTNLYELLQEEQKNGATIFFSSHVLAEVQKVCTRIGLIKNGSMIKETSAADFTNIGYRTVRLETTTEVNFSSLNGVAGLQQDGNTYHFMYSGKADDLIKLLNTVSVTSIHIEEPELENVFMHYFNNKN
ncbi:MAG: ABC transporter ATP-binding protein, partial [Bacteroidetes bacterium]|nr:ABC transporter ATP-binding protein [Bacteroidota bacterium]